MIFDTYAHYNDEAFDTDHRELLGNSKDTGITSMMNVAVSLDSCVTTLRLTKIHGQMYAAQGIRLSETAELGEEKIRRTESCCAHGKVKAMGETGPDYHWEEPNHSTQKKQFVRQLDLVRRTEPPVVVRSRDVAKDILDMMKVEKAGDMSDVIHCFFYEKEIVREYLSMGLFLGVGGVTTFSNARKLKEVVEYAPPKSLVLETDCPCPTSVPNRGERNSFLSLIYVVDAIDGIRGTDRGTVTKMARENALRLYRIGPVFTSDV